MLPAKHRLKKSEDIEEIKKSGKSASSKFFTVKFKSRGDNEPSRFAAVISNNVSKVAPKRNAIKRVLWYSVRRNAIYFKNGFNVVIIAKKSTERAYTDEMMNDAKNVLIKAIG